MSRHKLYWCYTFLGVKSMDPSVAMFETLWVLSKRRNYSMIVRKHICFYILRFTVRRIYLQT